MTTRGRARLSVLCAVVILLAPFVAVDAQQPPPIVIKELSVEGNRRVQEAVILGRVQSKLDPRANCAYEVVIDGIDEAHVARAMAEGIRAACGAGVIAITAGNYGGKLGKFHFRLWEIVQPQTGG